MFTGRSLWVKWTLQYHDNLLGYVVEDIIIFFREAVLLYIVETKMPIVLYITTECKRQIFYNPCI